MGEIPVNRWIGKYKLRFDERHPVGPDIVITSYLLNLDLEFKYGVPFTVMFMGDVYRCLFNFTVVYDIFGERRLTNYAKVGNPDEFISLLTTKEQMRMLIKTKY